MDSRAYHPTLSQAMDSSEAQLEMALREACAGREDAVLVAAQVLAAALPDVARHSPAAWATQQALAAELAALDARSLAAAGWSTDDECRRVVLANRLWTHADARKLALEGEVERLGGGSLAPQVLQRAQRAIGNVDTLMRWTEAKLRQPYTEVAARVRSLHHFARGGGGDACGDVVGCPLLFIVTPVIASPDGVDGLTANRPSLTVAAASSAIAENRGQAFLAPEVRTRHMRLLTSLAVPRALPRTTHHPTHHFRCTTLPL